MKSIYEYYAKWIREGKLKVNLSKKSEVMEATSLSEARIYVGTYAKYNDGSIEGKVV